MSLNLIVIYVRYRSRRGQFTGRPPLAEAKYVRSRIDEVFNANLVNLSGLRFYGGNSDIKVVNEYMECFIPNKAERDRKLIKLFLRLSNLSTIALTGRPSALWQILSGMNPKTLSNARKLFPYLSPAW